MADKKKDEQKPARTGSPARVNTGGDISAHPSTPSSQLQSSTNEQPRRNDEPLNDTEPFKVPKRHSQSEPSPRHLVSSVAFAGLLPASLSAQNPRAGSPAGSRCPSVTIPGQPTGGFGGSQTTVRPRTQGRHRLSGLFSVDELSIDLSVTPSDTYRPGLIDQVGSARGRLSFSERQGEGAAGDKHHPMSMAGSSIGSSSLGSEYNYPSGAEQRKNRYKPFRRRWRRFQRKYKGCIFALISSLTSSLGSHFVHQFTSPEHQSRRDAYSPSYLLLVRHIGVLFPGIFIILYYRFWCKEKVFNTVCPLKEEGNLKRFVLSVARGVVDVISILLSYQAFQYLLQSEVSTILNSKPIIVQLLAHFTLGEEWGVVPIIMSFIAAFGVMIMSRPPFLVPYNLRDPVIDGKDFVSERLPGVGLSVGSMLLSSIVYCILRYLKDVHYSVFSIFIGTTGVIVGLGLTLGLNELKMPGSYKDLGYLITIACLVCCSSICIVIALQNEEAFVVSLVRSMDVIFSFIWEMFLENKYPDGYRGGGACIIMFCVVVIFFRKYLTHQDPNSKVYKRCAFLTR